MEKYVLQFIKEEIDMSTLPFICSEHLLKIGVTNVKDQLKICSQIQKLKRHLKTKR